MLLRSRIKWANLTEILFVTEILGIEVEVDHETNTIGTKIAIDVTVEIKVNDNVDLLTICYRYQIAIAILCIRYIML